MTGKSRFATDDPEILAFARGQKPLKLLLGLLAFAGGAALLVAILRGGSGETIKALGAVAVLCGLGIVLMLGDGWRIDRSAGAVTTWFSVLGVKFRKVHQLSAFTAVVVNAKGQNLAVCLDGEREVELWASTSAALAEAAAREISVFLGLEAGYTEQAYEASGRADEPEEVPELPAGSRLNFTAEGQALTVVQAPRGYGPVQIVVAAGIAALTLGAVVGLFLLMSDLRELLGCAAVMSLLPLGVGTLFMLHLHAEVGRPVRMVFSPELLQIEFPAMLGRKTVKLPVAEIADVGFFDLQADWSRHGSPMSREPSLGGHLVIRRQEVGDVHLGRGLSVDEQLWLRSVIERMATLHSQGGAGSAG